MTTFSINVAEQDDEGRWQHLFRVEGLPSIFRARVVAEIIRAGSPSSLVTITEWTIPTGKEVR